MADLEYITSIAEKSLSELIVNGGGEGYWLDRGRRLVRHCVKIGQLKEVKCFDFDGECLQIAALFYYAGCLGRSKVPGNYQHYHGVEKSGRGMVKQSRGILRQKLGWLLEPKRWELAGKIILESQNRQTKLIEAMILTDAVNLEDFGASGVFGEMARVLKEGGGVGVLLAVWRRMVDYDYWPARLRDGFRFEGVRKIAKARLEAATRFMRQLEKENGADDINSETSTGGKSKAGEQEKASRIISYPNTRTSRMNRRANYL